MTPQALLALLRPHHVWFDPPAQHFTGPPPAWAEHGRTGACHHEEGALLANFAAAFPGNVLEIGADHGVSTRYIHYGLDQAGAGQILAVDFKHKWDRDPCWPRRHVLTVDSYRLLPHQVRAVLPRVDWAFIDGDHSFPGAARDYLLARACGATRFLFHDTAAHHPPYSCTSGNQTGSDVRLFVAALESDPTLTVHHLETPCGMAYVEAL